MKLSLNHLLTIGATGMLAGAVVELTPRCRHITSIARTGRSLAELDRRIAEGTGAPHPSHTLLLCDYRQRPAFFDAIEEAIEINGPVDCTLVWMHGPSATNGSIDLARRLASSAESIDFYHVLGSSSIADLQASLDADRLHFDRINGLRYHQVVLGYVEEDGARRWLKNEEIVGGAVEAIEQGRERHIVGVVDG